MSKVIDRKSKIILLIVIFVGIGLFFINAYRDYSLKDSEITTAQVIDVTDVSYRGIISYAYWVNGKKYTGKTPIKLSENRKYNNSYLKIIDDLKIKYAVNFPWISEIIDERVK